MNRSPEALICSPVKDAEDARHSLDDMVALADTDPGAPFMPKVLEALVSLQQSDRAYFQGLRAQLKRTGCRVAMLDEALAKEASEESSRGPKQADLLIGLAQQRAADPEARFLYYSRGVQATLARGQGSRVVSRRAQIVVGAVCFRARVKNYRVTGEVLMDKSALGTILIAGTSLASVIDTARAADPVFQSFFTDACLNPVGALAARCAETPGGTGDLSGNSESSLNPSQPLSSQAAALGRAREKSRRASEVVAELRDMDPDKQRTGMSEGDAVSIGPFSLLLNGRRTWFDQDRDQGDGERGLKGDIWGAELGFDYRISDRTVLGGFLGYENTDSDYDKDEAGLNFTPQNNSGKIDADSYTVTLFGSYSFSDNLFMEGSAGYGATNYTYERNVVFQESTRTIPQTNVRTKADTDGEQYWASASMGYEFHREALSMGPYVRATYVKSTVDNYTEKDRNDSGLQMRMDVDDRTSMTTDVGLGTSYAISTGWGVLVPQARVEWEHEFDQDAQNLATVYVLDASQNRFNLEGDDPDRDYFNVGAGISAIFAHGMMAFVNYEGLVGYDDLSRHRVTAGLRMEF